MISLEFTTTACNRPEILERTYRSFTANLKGVDFEKSTLYINVDPAPNSNNINKIEDIASKYFGKVICNYPKSSNFAKAIIWCFNKVEGEKFFHLEDDWILVRKVHINEIINALHKTPTTYNLQCVLNRDKRYIKANENGEPTFIPSLFCSKLIKEYLDKMNDTLNPEYQIKKIWRNNNNFKQHRSIILNNRMEYSKDIGRDWLKSNKISRDYTLKGKVRPSSGWTPWISWNKTE